MKLRKGGDPEVHVIYNNAQKNSINISSMSASQIEEEISQVRIVCTRTLLLHRTKEASDSSHCHGGSVQLQAAMH